MLTTLAVAKMIERKLRIGAVAVVLVRDMFRPPAAVVAVVVVVVAVVAVILLESLVLVSIGLVCS